MPDFFATSDAWLAALRKESLSASVVYRRGSASIPDLAAMVVPREADLVERDGTIVRIEVWDFEISAADLDLGSGVTFPAAGDVIVFGGKNYTVCRIGELPEWKWADEHYIGLVVHTRNSN